MYCPLEIQGGYLRRSQIVDYCMQKFGPKQQTPQRIFEVFTRQFWDQWIRLAQDGYNQRIYALYLLLVSHYKLPRKYVFRKKIGSPKRYFEIGDR